METEVVMSRIAKSSLAVISGLALVLGLVSGASAKPSNTHHAGTKVVKSSSSAAAKKAAAKKAAAKKAAAKKAAAKKAAAKKAAAKKIAAKKAAEASKQAARKSLINAMLNAITPDAPADLPAPDANQSDESQGIAPGEMATMPIRCMAVYRDGKSPCFWYGQNYDKPTAQQFAFNEALKSAYNDQSTANQVAYDAFSAATVDARTALDAALTDYTSDTKWSQAYLDYLVATRDAQVALNVATLASTQVFIEAKYTAIADFDAATYDASTDSGAAALAALGEYRAASEALELEQFSKNLSDSTGLTDGIITRMQDYLDLTSSITSEEDLAQARDAYYADLSDFYYTTAVASNDSLKEFYDAVATTEGVFTELTGESPTHPEYYPWWWYGYDDPQVIVDPLPPVPVDCGVPFDDSVNSDGTDPAEKPAPVDCSMNPVDPIPGDGSGDSSSTGDGVDPAPGDGSDGTVDSGAGDNSDKPEIVICTFPPAPGYSQANQD